VALALAALGACGSNQPPADPPTGEQTPSRVDPWQNARERGIDFRAVGQEPGWYIEIDHGGSIHLVWDYMDREATMPAVQPVRGQGRTTYTVSGGAHQLIVIAEDRPCSDAMSGAPYPNTVVVTIDGRELHGCGQFLAR
jgi:putative lipoprotein